MMAKLLLVLTLICVFCDTKRMNGFKFEKSKKYKKSAFTLVEAVLTVVVLSILSVYAVSKMPERSVFDHKEQREKVLVMFKYAQKIALTQRKNVYVTQSGNVIGLCYENVLPCTKKVTYSGEPQEVTLQAPIDSFPASFNFNSKGQASSDEVLNVFGKTITIVKDSGYVYE